MPSRIRRELHRLREDTPGSRFENGFERTHVKNKALRTGLVALGGVLMLAAMVTFWLPGPNFVLVLAGLALIGGQSRTVAKLIDRGEVAGRRWYREVWTPFEHKRAAKVAGALVFAAGTALVGWYAWQHELVPFVQ